MTCTDWLSIAGRVEKATGPDGVLDRVLHKALRRGETTFTQYEPDGICPNYSASIDAMIALIERELSEWQWRVEKYRARNGGNRAIVATNSLQETKEATTPALALMAAFCRAMAERSEV